MSKNLFQENQRLQRDTSHRQGISKSFVQCDLVEIYDSEFSGEISGRIEELKSKFPGWLFAKVSVPSFKVDKTLILPFEFPSDLVYTLYGNSLEILQRKSVLIVQNNNINNARIRIIESTKEESLDTKKARRVYDIGRL